MSKITKRNWPAWLISGIFHPLLVPTYMLLLLLLINPFLFGLRGLGEPLARQTLVMVFLYTCFIPVVSVAIMKALDMVDSLLLEDRMQRIGPYLLVLVLYLWVYYNFARNGEVPTAYIAFMLGVVIALSITFFVNVFAKISAHAVGMGGMVGMVLLATVMFGSQAIQLGGWLISLPLLLMLTILAAGLTGSARLQLEAHTPLDVGMGFLVGFGSQLIALRYYF